MTNCVAVPIGQIQAVGRFCSSISQVPFPARWIRRIQTFLFFPKLADFVVAQLTSDRIENLNKEEAKILYEAMEPMYLSLESSVNAFDNYSRIERFLFGWWVKKARSSTERLGDIVETLAWGSNPTLRGFIDSAIASIESPKPESAQLELALPH